MRQRHLARPGAHAAAGQGRHRRRMVGRAERPLARQFALCDQSGHRPDLRGFQQFLRRHRRQYAGQALRQHRLARARRPDEQQVVTAGGRDLERALRHLLALDLAQVYGLGGWRQLPAHRPLQNGRAFEMIDQGDDRLRRQDVVAAAPHGFGAVVEGTDQPLPPAIGGNGRGQGAGDGGNLAVEFHLADADIAVERVLRNQAHHHHQGQHDRQVVMGALFGQVGRREVGDDAFGGCRQAYAGKGAAHTFAAFGDGLVAQPHDLEGDRPLGQDDLGLDPAHFGAFEGNCRDACWHVTPLSSANRRSHFLRTRNYPHPSAGQNTNQERKWNFLGMKKLTLGKLRKNVQNFAYTPSCPRDNSTRTTPSAERVHFVGSRASSIRSHKASPASMPSKAFS